jgi:hypothetical protein
MNWKHSLRLQGKMQMRITTLAGVLLAFLPACAAAQTQADSVHIRNECRRAAQIVETGHPAPHSVWANERIIRCGSEGGLAIAARIQAHRQTADPAELDAITRSLRTFRDGTVFRTSLEIAGERSASIPARVFAFRTLIFTLSPGRWLTYAQLVEEGQRGCFGLPRTPHDELLEGAPLPSGYRNLVQTLSASVAGDDSQPAEVRRAAQCTVRYAR